jgi:hypothetical protein
VGHIRLIRLPRTRSWNAVVDLLGADGSTEEIAGAVASAAENSLARAASDQSFRHAFWLLTQLPLAARAADFAARLQQLGVEAGPAPTLLSFTAAFQQAIDRRASATKSRTDFGEMACLAASETLTSVLASALPGLFDTTSEDLRYALGKLAVPDRFAKLSRQFFARLVDRNLEYFLSRMTADHIGPGRRFRSVGNQSEFREARAQHCYEAALIVEAFSGEWYSKTNWLGGITPAKAAGFSHIAFKKLRAELRRRAADG